MKKLLSAMAAVSALAMAAPAAAQSQYGYQNPYNNGAYNNGYGNGYNANANVDTRLARLDARIQAGVQNGTIDMREARRLRMQLREISRLDTLYSRNGYTQQERADLQARLRSFRDDLRVADGGSNGYGAYGSNGYNNGYGNNGYGYQGQGGPYEDAYCDTSSRGGLGGLIDNIFGGGGGDCTSYGYGVGARASSDWGAVPYQYRNQYRDGSGYYYRSDGRAVYQIDTRTNTVARVYPMNR
ncbi:MAG: hypothetical protein JOZ90_03660 [Alphaproteobacteria bacterium]|nr:hypothetical protein [Alphaproteobacteria bacterium]MBV9372674.1 hypothetical protein [Alphaproteobacteria bacterium]MBV9900176.1 hypothetical protein [Alphaproteobacteria bacterium]